ncbi:MAG TPA: YlxR family protein [Clostridiaceae bacterium]|nr:YlxR family protein [Clostridiaceae bacterium]
MKQRKIPMRMCLGCHEMKPKKELVRVVCNKENEVSVDLVGKKPGRGAYICRNIDCFVKARKGKKFEKAFETSISDEVYDLLAKQVEGDSVQ